jgi:tetratricopeptide (TPR) repeat protein
MKVAKSGCAHLVWFLAFILVVSLSIFGQNTESLGDAARRARQQKEKEQGAAGISAEVFQPQVTPKTVSVLRLFAWLAGGMPDRYIVREIRARGLSFVADDKLIESAKSAGADADLVSELQKGSQTATPAEAEPGATNGIIQAAILMKHEDYRGAQREIRTLLGNDAKNADLYFALGKTYQQMENWDSAGPAYAHAVQLAPDFAYAWGQLSFMFYKVEDPMRAVAAAEEMIKLQPDSGDAHKYLGLAEYAAGNDPEALKEYRQSIALEPSQASVYFDRGLVQSDLHAWQNAVDDYQHAAKLGFVHWNLYNMLGNALAAMNRTDEAVAAYEKGKALDPSRPEIRQSYGATLCNSGRYAQAVREFQELLSLVPDWNMARPCLYRSLMRIGRTEEAKQVKEDYANHDPDHETW